MNILVRKQRGCLKILRLFSQSKKPIGPVQLIDMAKQQAPVDFSHYDTSRSVFSKLLQKGYLDDHTMLVSVMSAMNSYPSIEMEQQTVDEIYQIVQPIVHRLNSQTVTTMLIFMSKCDRNLQTSLIYDHVLKYYLKNQYEMYKSRLAVDTSTNILTIFRKVASRLLTMGYTSKVPPYEKTLMIPEHLRLQLLQNLLRQSWNQDSLLIRKVYYQWFHRMKCYYEQQMRENLYHEKNVNYMRDLCQYAVVLGQRCQVIEEQNSLMRELFYKMYQVMKKQGRQIIHSHQMCRLVNAVSMPIQDIKELILTAQYIGQCGYEESVQLIKYHHKELLEMGTLSFVFNRLLTPAMVFYLKDVMSVIKIDSQFVTLFEQYIDKMPLLKLDETLQLAKVLLNSKKCIQQLVCRILKIEQATVSHQNIKDMLVLVSVADLTPQRQAIRCYTFKYLSDHHRQLPLQLYKQCLELIEGLPDGRKVFDSQYKDILAELADYNKQLQ